MKAFTITIEIPDKYPEEEVLYSVMGSLPLDNYTNLGIRFKTHHELAVKYQEFCMNVGAMALLQPSKIKS